MKVKIGDLKLEDGTTIREMVYECKKCKHYGDSCDGDITDIEVEIPQTVKHGRWEYDEHAVDLNIGGWCCSECDTCNNNLPTSEAINPYQFSGSSYCPQCGAKMDETEDGGGGIMGAIEYGKCDVCGKYGAVERTYYHYGIKCECHSPEHFEIVRTCLLCEPREPRETKLILSTEYLKRISAILSKEA